MRQQVILDEGGSVNIHTRIKDMCKSARNRLSMTNQEISNQISDRFGIEDFSVNTVNNFFSERSKATTIYTTGYICAVLGISIDAIFGIIGDTDTSEDADLLGKLAELNVELRLKEQEIEALKKQIEEKNQRLDHAHATLDHYRKECDHNMKKVQPWVFITVLILLVCSLVFIVSYLLIYDVHNPAYGIFRQAHISADLLMSWYGPLCIA